MKISFALPAYNEEFLIKKNLIYLFNFLNKQNYNFNWDLVLIINGTSDNSELIAKEIANKNTKIKIFTIKERGKGGAIKKYFNYSNSDILIYMDIDLAVSLENINDLLKALLEENAELVIGSRLLKNSKTKRSIIRSISSKLYILLSKQIIKHNFSDLQCGFKGIKRDTWKKISPKIKDEAWFFDTELLILCQRNNVKIKEIPVNWKENRYEKRKSKIKLLKDSFIFIKKLIKLKNDT